MQVSEVVAELINAAIETEVYISRVEVVVNIGKVFVF
jgi:hypothetical protein